MTMSLARAEIGVVTGIAWLAACLAASCTAEAPLPPPVVIPLAPASTTGIAVTATPRAGPQPRRFVVSTRHLAESIDDDTGPAPCDFARLYRGKIGDEPISVLLGTDGHGALTGLLHEDRVGPAVPLTGTRSGERDFSFDPKGGGHFAGRCLDNGWLDGVYTLGTRKRSFRLHPRPVEWPPMYRVLRATPQAKKALHAGAPRLLCSAEDQQMRVFGLADPRVEASVNRILDGAWFDAASKELKGCSDVLRLYHYEGLVAARRDLLVVSNFTSNDYGGAHPANSGGASVAIDLTRGVEIHLSELVDEAALRRVAIDCLPFHRATAEKKEFELPTSLPPATCADEPGLGSILWGCEKEGLQAPVWTLLPEGIVLGSWANAHALAVLDGKGPVIPWSVLVREKALPASSPVARLWAGARAAPKDAVACPMSYWGETLDEWREEAGATRTTE